MSHNAYATTANEVSNQSYQNTTYFSSAPTSYQTVSSMSFPSTTTAIADEEHKNEYILINASDSSSRLHSMATTSSGLIKEHPAVAQADQMNAFIDSYFVGDQHGASTSAEHDEHGIEHIQQIKKGDDELDAMLKGEEMDDMQDQLHMDQSEGSDSYREERSRQRRAAAARSRYQRMTENERRLYNHRRRLRQLGLDPENSKTDMEMVREQVKLANAKKAEAARQRYHRMTPEQKRDYNLRRTEAFRRRRQEEEALLSTPAGRISAEALAKAQQIMVRNARKAESARLRYQRMTQEERKEYNLKRAAAKKTRKEKEEDEHEHEHDGVDDMPSGENSADIEMHDDMDHDVDEMNLSSEDNGLMFEESLSVDVATQEQHMLDIINEVATPTQLEIFAQMEKDVVRRTKQAHMVLQRQQGIGTMDSMMVGELVAQSVSNTQSNAIVGGIQYDIAPSAIEHELMSQPHQSQPALPPPTTVPNVPSSSSSTRVAGRRVAMNNGHSQSHDLICTEVMPDMGGPSIITKEHLIDEKALQDMLITGLDPSGHPVEIRMADGTPITGTEIDFNFYNGLGGQPLLITSQLGQERKPTILAPSTSDYNMGTSAPMIHSGYQTQQVVVNMQNSHHHQQHPEMHVSHHNEHNEHNERNVRDETYGVNDEDLLNASTSEKQAVNRAKRAERARLRYHRMSQEERKEQNARRAEMLRKSRQRDDELCHIADNLPPEQIDEATQKAIQEAQRRRLRRAQQARDKYHRMNSEQRRQYNAMRDAQRRQRKREQENRLRQQQLEMQQAENGENDHTLDISGPGDHTNSDVNDPDGLYSYDEMFPNDAWDR